MRVIQRPKVCRGRHRLAAAAAVQQPSSGDQHHQPSSSGYQQQPPSAVDHQLLSALDQHRQPSFPAKTTLLPSSAQQQQPPSAGDQPQPFSEQQQPVSAGEQQSLSAARQRRPPSVGKLLSEHPAGEQQSPSAAELSQPQLPFPGDSHQQPSAAVKHQPLSAADQCQPPSADEQKQQQGVLESINNLRAFNHALTLFLSRFDALTDHLSQISTSIAVAAASGNPNQEATTVVAAPELETTVLASPVSDLDTSCRCWKSLREYVTTHLSDVDRLRAQVPAALQRAPDTARVVLNVILCGGRYYLNPPWAYEGANNPKVAERHVCILILEFFLSGCFPSEHELICWDIKLTAGRIAVHWRERLIGEGGIASVGVVDALGLLLFLGSFGVPKKFSFKDLCKLLHLSKSEKEAHVLRRSPFLLEKMPGVINYMTSKDMHTEAVDFVFLFGLEEKFDPLSVLSCLLHKAKQASEEEVRDEQLSLISVKESNERFLTVLESVAKCIGIHKLDTSESDFNIERQIVMLQTENVEIAQKLKDRSMKRNAEEAGPLNTPETQPKCPRPSATELTPEKVIIVSELDTSCRRWKTLRWYVTTHLSDVERLRDEVPAALQRAPDPAQVVLNVIHSGRYYLDPPWSYEGTNNPKVTKRRVCILILEFYLSSCFPTQRDLIHWKIDSKAVTVAFEWRKRLISEGGIASAGAVDSLGLLLFLGSFGVPEEFSSEDLYELLHLTKLEKEAHVLRKSPFLLEKMHDVINDKASKDMVVEAVDIVFLFGLEEKFDPLSMLSCLLRKAQEVLEETRDEQLSLITVKESNEKYLTVLESVAKCLGVYKLDSSVFDFNIEQRIMTLRTKNAEIVRKLKDRNIKRKNAEILQRLKDRNIKRNAEEAGPSHAPGTPPKRLRPSATELTREIPGI